MSIVVSFSFGGSLFTHKLDIDRTDALIPFVDQYTYYVTYTDDLSTAFKQVPFKARYSNGLLSLIVLALDRIHPYTVDVSPINPIRITVSIHDRIIIELLRTDLRVHVRIPQIDRDAEEFSFPFSASCNAAPNFCSIIETIQAALYYRPTLRRTMFGAKPENRAKCARCKTVIESRTRHEFVSCPCGSISVDGGMEYYRRVGAEEDFAELLDTDVVEYRDDKTEGDPMTEPTTEEKNEPTTAPTTAPTTGPKTDPGITVEPSPKRGRKPGSRVKVRGGSIIVKAPRKAKQSLGWFSQYNNGGCWSPEQPLQAKSIKTALRETKDDIAEKLKATRTPVSAFGVRIFEVKYQNLDVKLVQQSPKVVM